ncbi:MAG TPA: histidine kinase [Bacteroidia bacterium]|nr:histidine kinase [Bacteroidia bacterium]
MKRTGSGFKVSCVAFAIVSSFLISSGLFAQNYIFSNINTGQGLPGSEVYRIIQDKKGYIWGITEGGVFKYNGAVFKTFTIEDGLPGYTFFNLFEDYKGRIWVSSFDGKVGYFLDDVFYTTACNDSLAHNLQFGNRLIYDLYVDQHDTLWLGTSFRMIKVFPEHNYQRFEELKPTHDTVARVIFEPDSGQLISSNSIPDDDSLIFTRLRNQKLYQYVNIQTKHIHKAFPFLAESIFTVFPYIRQTFLSHGDLLYTYQNSILIVHKDGTQDERLFADQIVKLTVDRYQNLWVCFAKGGVLLFKYGNLNSEPKHFFDGITISDVLVDSEDGIWISSLGSGIYYAPTMMATVFTDPDLQNKIIGISKIGNTVYAVNQNHQFVKVDSSGNCFNIRQIQRPFNSGRLRITPYDNKIFLCGGITGWFDKELNQIALIKNENNASLNAQDMAFGDNDSLYILSYGSLYTYYKSKLVHTIKLPARGRMVLKTGNNDFLIGTLNGLYHLKDGSFDYLGNSNPSLKTRVNYLYHDKENRIWVCTKGSGVLFFENRQWREISIKDGLASNLCNSIVEAENNTFYVGTRKGISRITLNDTSGFSVSNYRSSDGLPSEEVFCLEYFNNNLYAGTQKGLVKINASAYWLNRVPPPVYVNKIILNDSIQISPDVFSKFRHDENNLLFYVDVLSFKDSKNVTLKYVLQGKSDLEKDLTGNKIEFQNLSPGTYTLKVWGVNNSGLLSKQAAVYKFSISKPYWLTWWFIFGELLVAVLLTYLFIKWRSTVIHKINKEKFETEKKLSAFQLQALRAQMNPHFVFNAINSIQSQILQKNQHEAYSLLTKFSQLIRLILVNTNENIVALSKEIEAIRLYIELEQLRFAEKFEFDLQIDENVDIENTVIPSMILQPFLENAIWHGLMPLNGLRKAKLSMHISQEGEKILAVIEDNGIGIENSANIKKMFNHKSLGITLTRRRLELISMSGSTINIKNITDSNNNTAGTRVEIVI